MKSFSIVRDTRRGTQSYMEKRRGMKEIEVTRKRREGVKREETNLVSNHSIRVLQSPEHPERFTELIEKRKGR